EGKLLYWKEVQKEIEEDDRIIGSAPRIQFEGMMNVADKVSGALLQGIVPAEEEKVADVHEHMVAGSMDSLVDGEYNIILGKDLALSLGVDMGGKVTLITPQAQVTPAGILPRMRRFTVSGVFSVGMYEYDRSTAFVHLGDAARLMKFGDDVSSLRLKLTDLEQAPRVARELNNRLGPAYWVSDWTREHENFFRALKTEKSVMFIILLLIVTVAAFNIVSTLVMLVNDKRPDIAILRTLGLTPGQVMGVFMVQGTLIGFLGTVIGVVSGALLASNVDVIVPAIESFFHTKFLPADVYYISELPSDLRLRDILVISLVSFTASMVMTIYPAWQASRTQPAEALRYE
ncbi:MAG TPA: lipoprotein-releasing ABC transporter permease subunit, partial [Gammaproteobacteria bacterium]|nr:lipoprotein-releasing ABC transporter permease subunit [Gammaproteobacteria bacterium]